MKLDKVEIRGYKSLKDVIVRLGSDMCTIIGVNDIGKSSVLQAIEIFLNNGKPETTYFHNGGREMSIGLTFRANNEEIEKLSGKVQIDDKGKFTIIKTFTIDDEGKVKGPDIFLGSKKIQARDWKEIEPHLPRFVYVQSLRDADKFTKITQSSPLGRLLLPLLDRVSSHKMQLEAALRDVTYDLRRDLEFFLKEQSPNVVRLHIEPSVNFDKSIEIVFEVEDAFHRSGIESRGSGIQSSLVVGIFRAYAKYRIGRNTIFGIEEPEAYLHTGAQRKLFAALQEVASRDGQVIITTHSTVFIDRGQLSGISLLKRNERGEVEIKRITEESHLKVIKDTLEQKNSDWLLWDAVVLVEGGTERVVLHEIAKKMLKDKLESFDSLGINILPVGGKSKMLYFANVEVLKSFGIPFIVVIDRDEQDPEELKNYLVKNAKISPENCIVLKKREIENYYPPKAIEAAFPDADLSNIQFGDDENVKAQLMTTLNASEVAIGLRVARCMDIQDIHPDIREIVYKAVSLVSPTISKELREAAAATQQEGNP